MASVHIDAAFARIFSEAGLAPYEALGKKIQKRQARSMKVDDAQPLPGMLTMSQDPNRLCFLSLLAVILGRMDEADAASTVHQILSVELDKSPPLEDVQGLVNRLCGELYPSGNDGYESQYQREFGTPELILQNGLERLIDRLRSRLGFPTLYHQRDGVTKLIDAFRFLAEPKTSLEYNLHGGTNFHMVDFQLVLGKSVHLSGCEDSGNFRVTVTGLRRRVLSRRLALMVFSAVVAMIILWRLGGGYPAKSLFGLATCYCIGCLVVKRGRVADLCLSFDPANAAASLERGREVTCGRRERVR